jgi:hypothetical protein
MSRVVVVISFPNIQYYIRRHKQLDSGHCDSSSSQAEVFHGVITVAVLNIVLVNTVAPLLQILPCAQLIFKFRQGDIYTDNSQSKKRRLFLKFIVWNLADRDTKSLQERIKLPVTCVTRKALTLPCSLKAFFSILIKIVEIWDRDMIRNEQRPRVLYVRMRNEEL